MQNYIGLIISLENYHDSKIKKVHFAENDIKKFKEALVNAGCDPLKITTLSDNFATKTSIQTKLDELVKYAQPTETLVFYFAGHGFNSNGTNWISTVDTALDNIEGTSISTKEILSSFEKSKSKKIIAFLDCCHSGINFKSTERNHLENFSADSLKYEYHDSEHLTVFASCKSDEKSQVDFNRKHGVWSYYLIEALNGNVENLYEDGLLFSDKLQRYLSDNVPDRVRKITESKKHQTPVKFGKETTERFIVADISKNLDNKKVENKKDNIPFRKAVFLVEYVDSVKNLPGFKNSHTVPKENSDYHNSWIQKIAAELLTDELNEIGSKLKIKLKYKRRDIENPEIWDGSAQLSTKDFDYIIEINQTHDDPSSYTIKRSIENFTNSNILEDDNFNEIFKNTFDEISLEFTEKLDIEDFIDHIEEIENEKISIQYDTFNMENCKIRIEGFPGSIIVNESSLRIIMSKLESPKDLINDCLKAYQQLNLLGVKNLLN